MIRKVVIFTGRVQGVGFRYTTADLAKRYAVAGYVQNLPDGRVRLEVQGEKKEVEALVRAVCNTMADRIHAKDATECPPDDALGRPGDADAFVVRY